MCCALNDIFAITHQGPQIEIVQLLTKKLVKHSVRMTIGRNYLYY